MHQDDGLHVFSDGSADGGDVGAAAVLFRGHTEIDSLLLHLGPATVHTIYEAEAVGAILALHLLREHHDFGPSTVGLDNTPVISASRHVRPALAST